MTLTQLKYFLALCESGTFANAAELCHISQPTLSLQLKKLETFVGAVLIDRSQSPIKPTPFGRVFAQQAQAVFGEVSKLEALYEAESPNLEGALALGCIPTISYYLLLPLIQYFKQHFPLLHVSIYELPTHELLDRLESGFLDVAIMAGPIQSRHLYEQQLYFEPFVVLLNQSAQQNLSHEAEHSVIQVDALESISLLMLGEEHCLRGQTQSICRFKSTKKSKGTIECSSVAMMKSLVSADIAAAILPQLCLSAADISLKLSNPNPGRVVSLVHRTNFHKTRTLDALTSAVLQIVPQSMQGKQELKIVGIDHE